MEKIQKTNLHNLHNEEHYAFMTDVQALLNASNEPVKAALVAQLPEFEALLKREDAALEYIRQTLLTKEVAEIDHLRDNLWYAIRLKVQAYAYSNVDSDVKASAELQIVADHYGTLREMGYNEESGAIQNLVQELRARGSAMVITGLEQWVNDLELLNNNVKKLMGDRYDESAATARVEKVRDIRREIDALYQRIAEVISASAIIKGEADYADFIDRLNERIRYYKNAVAIRKGHAKAKNEEEANKVEGMK